ARMCRQVTSQDVMRLVTIGVMRGTVYRQCWCRDPDTGRKLHGKCPQLGKRGHGRWYFRYEAPRAPGQRRRQPVGGPFDTRREAEEELADALARIGGGGTAPDRSVRVAAYLDGYLAGKVNLKARARPHAADRCPRPSRRRGDRRDDADRAGDRPAVGDDAAYARRPARRR